MSKKISNDSGDGFIALAAPDNFELDEIEWDDNEYPMHFNAIPFENTTKKILKEFEHLLPQANNKL